MNKKKLIVEMIERESRDILIISCLTASLVIVSLFLVCWTTKARFASLRKRDVERSTVNDLPPSYDDIVSLGPPTYQPNCLPGQSAATI